MNVNTWHVANTVFQNSSAHKRQNLSVNAPPEIIKGRSIHDKTASTAFSFHATLYNLQYQLISVTDSDCAV
jgi:hypothetical protein